jgi:bifunctional DNase/RNase
MAEQLTKVSVSDVRVAVAAGPGVEAGLVTLREDDPPHRSVPIVIGQSEAKAIQSAWTGAVQSRPSTWDLFISAVGVLEARLDRVVITAVEEHRHFFARVEFERSGEKRVLEARPSDAIALALRAYDAQIFVAETVLEALDLPAEHKTITGN